jgi:putative transposase
MTSLSRASLLKECYRYFVTICTYNRICLFGDIEKGTMLLSPEGEIIKEEWLQTAKFHPDVELDSFVIMPNHFHCIIVMNEKGGSNGKVTLQGAPIAERSGKAASNSTATIVRLFTSVTSKRINQMHGLFGTPVWQQNYYEHIIRSDDELNNIRGYILDNPLNWPEDDENPVKKSR